MGSNGIHSLNGIEWGELPEPDGGTSQGIVHEYTRVLQILWPKPGVRITDIEALAFVPRPFDPHPSYPLALARTPRVTSEKRFVWRVTIPYSTELESPPDQDENPLARPARISIRGRGRSAPYFTDSNGLPLVNTAGDPLLGATREFHDAVINVQKNLAALPSWLDTYIDSINSDDVRIKGRTWKKGTLLYVPESFDEVQDAKRFYWDAKIQLIYNREGWTDVFPNVGRRELKPGLKGEDLLKLPEEERAAAAQDKLIDILVGDPPRVTTEPVWLDRNGAAIRDSAGNVKTKLDPSELIFIEREPHGSQPFTRLPIR